WSLSVEAFFYLVFPFLLLRFRKIAERKLLIALFGFCLLSIGFSFSYVLVHPDGLDKINSGETNLFWKNVLSFNPLVRLPEFIVGMLTCRLFLARRNSTKPPSFWVFVGVIAFVVVVLSATKIPNPVLSAGVLSPAFAVVIYGIACQPKWTS